MRLQHIWIVSRSSYARVISQLLVDPGATLRHVGHGASRHAARQVQTIPAGRSGEHEGCADGDDAGSRCASRISAPTFAGYT